MKLDWCFASQKIPVRFAEPSFAFLAALFAPQMGTPRNGSRRPRRHETFVRGEKGESPCADAG